MVNIIIQHFTGDMGELEKASVLNIGDYAASIGAEYKLLYGQVFREDMTTPIQKMHMLSEEFDDYDDLVMLDIDMFAPIGMTENVFDVDGIGLHENVQTDLHHRLVRTYPHLASLEYPYWGGAIYKLSRSDRQQLRSGYGKDNRWMYTYNRRYHWGDEGIMHTLACRSNFKPKSPYMNKKWCQCSFLPHPENAGFIHIRPKITPHGPKREKYENYVSLKEKGI